MVFERAGRSVDKRAVWTAASKVCLLVDSTVVLKAVDLVATKAGWRAVLTAALLDGERAVL
jgi:hypothetical protein